MSSITAPPAILVCVLSIIASGPSPARENGPVRSLFEMRNSNIVIQNWDLSCGAAALATILNFQHGDYVSEREIAIGLMSRSEYLANPVIVRIRQGFSLLDLKHYVDARGYQGRGLGRLNLEHLVERAPIIVPVNILGYQHFVVFRGSLGNRVLLADPAFGHRTMLRSEFERSWIEYAAFGHVGFVVERKDGLIPPNRLEAKSDDYVTFN